MLQEFCEAEAETMRRGEIHVRLLTKLVEQSQHANLCICSDTLTYKLVVAAVAVVEAERTLASRLVKELARHIFPRA